MTVQVHWVLQDARRAGGVERVVGSLSRLVDGDGNSSVVVEWYPDRQPGRGSVWWLYDVARDLVRRRRAASVVARRLRAEIVDSASSVVVLEPGSLEVARRLRGLPRWALHVHWDPDRLLNPHRHAAAEGAPALLLPLLRARLRWVGHRNRRLVRAAPLVVTLTESHTRQLTSSGARVVQIANPVEVVPRERPPAAEVPTIGYVGRLSHEKGPDVLMEALALMADDHTPMRVLVAGDGPMRSLVERAVRSMPSVDVQLLGWRDDVPELLSTIDVFVLPSRNEAVPSVLVEALAAGATVVAADAGPGVRDLVTAHGLGWVVPAADPEALARALRLALTERRGGQVPPAAAVVSLLQRHDPVHVRDAWLRELTLLVTT